MRTVIVTLLLTAAAVAVPAAPLSLEEYLDLAMPVCPGREIVIDRVTVGGPRNFESFRVNQTSSDEHCGQTTYALVSPMSGQVLLGPVFSIEGSDAELVPTLAETMEKMMNLPVTVSLADKPVEDGLVPVDFTAAKGDDELTFRAWLDASRTFLILGRRGNLREDPRKTLLDALNVDDAVQRGADGAGVQIVEISDLQCPACRHAHETIETYFDANRARISYVRIDHPLFFGHDWALQAALAAKATQDVAPQHYWTFVDHIFGLQEQIKAGMMDSIIRDFAEMYDIDWPSLQKVYRSADARREIVRQVGRAFSNGIFATPTFLVNGRQIWFGPNGANLKSYVESLETGR